jgi:hypothetical protein
VKSRQFFNTLLEFESRRYLSLVISSQKFFKCFHKFQRGILAKILATKKIENILGDNNIFFSNNSFNIAQICFDKLLD